MTRRWLVCLLRCRALATYCSRIKSSISWTLEFFISKAALVGTRLRGVGAIASTPDPSNGASDQSAVRVVTRPAARGGARATARPKRTAGPTQLHLSASAATSHCGP